MPFAKGNTIWKEGHKARAEGKERNIDLMFGMAAEGGAQRYAELLDLAARGEDIGKMEQLFMTKYENMFEYMKPKRARVDEKGSAAEATVINVVNYKEDK